MNSLCILQATCKASTHNVPLAAQLDASVPSLLQITCAKITMSALARTTIQHPFGWYDMLTADLAGAQSWS